MIHISDAIDVETNIVEFESECRRIDLQHHGFADWTRYRSHFSSLLSNTKSICIRVVYRRRFDTQIKDVYSNAEVVVNRRNTMYDNLK